MGWFGRIRESIKGIVVGLIFFVIGFPVLWFNEKNSAETIAGLNQLMKETVTVDSSSVNAEFEGRPVHLSGSADTDEVLSDGRFGVSAPAIKLIRDVKMYQWQENRKSETKKKLGGGEETVTTYSYSKVWSKEPIDSGQFNERGRAGHQNPPMPYLSKTHQAKDVSLDAFRLSPFLVGQMNQHEPLALDSEQRGRLPADMRAKLKDDGPGYYQGADPGAPQIGDLRINFHVVNPGTVSIIAKQVGDSFEKFYAKNGKSFGLLEMGQVSKENVVQVARGKNKLFTWLLRFVGWLVMFLGLALVLKPLSVLADVVPMIGNVVGFGTGLIAAIIAAGISLLVIAVAWVVYRPLLSIPLAILAIGLIIYAFTRKQKAVA